MRVKKYLNIFSFTIGSSYFTLQLSILHNARKIIVEFNFYSLCCLNIRQRTIRRMIVFTLIYSYAARPETYTPRQCPPLIQRIIQYADLLRIITLLCFCLESETIMNKHSPR